MVQEQILCYCCKDCNEETVIRVSPNVPFSSPRCSRCNKYMKQNKG